MRTVLLSPVEEYGSVSHENIGLRHVSHRRAGGGEGGNGAGGGQSPEP
eukprot:CAMPEP_0182929160 /NCGR_PEP_ID=MMETSP0105_2-20130417/19869_1 /TAXON_ID=81532 ORGANISM="Acanthoeca-like sp., Strain 10tr" /NCGR_SAMPLE_ID=MMETSP0105_2 /ASSEMBLY_ACC=CAM_ASM_000205 /LENGTH=47 /DNA_ID= /DNA_START= /DNA_END= /DNA_ORIENTATION=